LVIMLVSDEVRDLDKGLWKLGLMIWLWMMAAVVRQAS
jgi:hypothetical protein